MLGLRFFAKSTLKYRDRDVFHSEVGNGFIREIYYLLVTTGKSILVSFPGI